MQVGPLAHKKNVEKIEYYFLFYLGRLSYKICSQHVSIIGQGGLRTTIMLLKSRHNDN